MKKQETQSKTEEKSTTSATGTSGSRASEKELDYFDEEEKYGKRVVGEMRLLLFEDETVIVSFPNLGRFTPGRLEKAMPRIFRACISERSKAYRASVGLPTEFVGEQGVSDDRAE